VIVEARTPSLRYQHTLLSAGWCAGDEHRPAAACFGWGLPDDVLGKHSCSRVLRLAGSQSRGRFSSMFDGGYLGHGRPLFGRQTARDNTVIAVLPTGEGVHISNHMFAHGLPIKCGVACVAVIPEVVLSPSWSWAGAPGLESEGGFPVRFKTCGPDVNSARRNPSFSNQAGRVQIEIGADQNGRVAEEVRGGSAGRLNRLDGITRTSGLPMPSGVTLLMGTLAAAIQGCRKTGSGGLKTQHPAGMASDGRIRYWYSGTYWGSHGRPGQSHHRHRPTSRAEHGGSPERSFNRSAFSARLLSSIGGPPIECNLGRVG